jgi:peptidoglycan/LPS O-acetylase OafA/YrhL
MTSTFSDATVRAFNPVYWTLAVEEQFYLALPLLAATVGRRPAWLLASIPASHLVVAGLRALLPTHELLIEVSLPYRWDAFALGMLVATAVAADGRRVERGAGALVRGVLGAVGLVAPLVVSHLMRTRVLADHQLALGLEAAGSALLLTALLTGPRGLGAPWRLGPVCALGLLTYSVYLWHGWVAEVVRAHTAPPDGPAAAAARVVLVLLGTLPIALVSWALVERPFQRLRERWR